MITVGPMALNQPQAADPMEPFFLGTQSGGGYWTDISRLSSHDHSGGLMGAAVAVNIPDGSITAADLDPSVLAPYALVDGSKPFTGQVTMQADAVIRDELLFGPQGSAAAPDVHVQRTGAGALRVDNRLGVGVDPIAWGSGHRALQVGGQGALWGDTGTTGAEAAYLSINTYFDGTSFRALGTSGGASLLRLQQGTLAYQTAPTAAQFGALTFTTRASIAPTGTLTLTPDAGAIPLVMNRPEAVASASTPMLVFQRANAVRWSLGVDNGDRFTLYNPAYGTPLAVSQTGTLTLTPDAGQAAVQTGGVFTLGPHATYPSSVQLFSSQYLMLGSAAGYVQAPTDNNHNLGSAGARWVAVYAVNGTIQTSSAAMKEGITPLSPAECYQAVLETDWVSFSYLPPAYQEPEPAPDVAYDASDSNEVKAEKKAARDEADAKAKAAYAKMLVETAPARKQKGFVLQSAEHKTHELYGLADRESTSPGSDHAVTACALQHTIVRLQALEAEVAALKAPQA